MEIVECTYRYSLPGTLAALGPLVTTADGLSRWFADSATQDGPWLTFLFEDDAPRARVLVQTAQRLRFQWEGQDDIIELGLSETADGTQLVVIASTRSDAREAARTMWDDSVALLIEALR